MVYGLKGGAMIRFRRAVSEYTRTRERPFISGNSRSPKRQSYPFPFSESRRALPETWSHDGAAPHSGLKSEGRGSDLLSFADHTRILLVDRPIGPSHAGSVVGDAEVALRIEDDDAAVSVD